MLMPSLSFLFIRLGRRAKLVYLIIVFALNLLPITFYLLRLFGTLSVPLLVMPPVEEKQRVTKELRPTWTGELCARSRKMPPLITEEEDGVDGSHYYPVDVYASDKFDQKIVELRLKKKDTVTRAIELSEVDFRTTLLQPRDDNDNGELKVRDPKYFKEATSFVHADRRYYVAELCQRWDKRLLLQVSMYRAWYEFADSVGIPHWLAHGTLLGWTWNQKIMPFDRDMDLQTTMLGMEMLAFCNQTIWDERYLVDVNGQIANRSYSRTNTVDARFIDTKSGLLIDITALAFNSTQAKFVGCKNRHYHSVTDITPLHLTELEGVPAWRPHETIKMLCEEYGCDSMTKKTFRGYKFDTSKEEWIWPGPESTRPLKV